MNDILGQESVDNRAKLLIRSLEDHVDALMDIGDYHDLESDLAQLFGSVCSGLSCVESFTSPELNELVSLLDRRFEALCRTMEQWLLQVENDLLIGRNIEELKKILIPCFMVLKGMKELAISVQRDVSEVELKDLMLKRHFACTIMAHVKVDGFQDFIGSLEQWGEYIGASRRALTFQQKLLLIYSMYAKDEDAPTMTRISINRSKLLEESVYKICAIPITDFKFRLDIKFRHEMAVGFGVVREWLVLVSKQLFSNSLGLFESCGPSQRLRPISLTNDNSAGVSREKGLVYYHFAGIMVSLVFKYKIQIGVRFDRTFFAVLQRKGYGFRYILCLEDIKETDEDLYKGYTNLLAMDSEKVASMDLFFVGDDDTPLSKGGHEKKVTLENRGLYVLRRLQQKFVQSILEEVSWFCSGFTSVLDDQSASCEDFFRYLSLGDVDRLLGEGKNLSIEEWKGSIVYVGYSETDLQIGWFWEVVEAMSENRRRNLLYFWTSNKYLPIDGFGGLSIPPTLAKSEESANLPSAHTCVSTLNLPAYESKEDLEKNMNIITSQIAYEGFGFI